MELINAAIPSYRERSRVVLADVNWRICSGDYWAIAGLARSGKTDLIMVLAGVIRPRQGEVRLFGKTMGESAGTDDWPERRRIGLVFDGGQLINHLSLEENVALPLRYHGHHEARTGDTDRRIADLIGFTGLAEWAGARPGEVNRNWRQRFGLARALAMMPEVLVLDSPLSGLDPRDTGWWLETLDRLAAGHPILGDRPVTIAVTGDDLRPWQSRARKFAALSDGKFVEVGGRHELALHPEPLLRDLLPIVHPDS